MSNKANFRITLILVSIVLLIVFMLDIGLGSVDIPISEVLHIILGRNADNQSWNTIILLFRIPKAITALMAGGSLAVSGLIMQSFFRNPLAGPFVLGISSGASLGVAFFVMAGFSFTFFIHSLGIVIASIFGSSIAFTCVLLAATRIKDTSTLLIIGLMIGSVSSAIVGILQYFSTEKQLQTFTLWTLGSLSNVYLTDLPLFIGCTSIGVFISFLLFKPMNAILLGEEYAKSLGVNITKLRSSILIATGLLAGVVTAYCGPIAFIGIAVPHLTKLIIRTNDHKKMIPLVFLMGALVLLICDIISQLPNNETVLPINSITSILGIPIIIWIILKKRNIGTSY